ncbi:MAG: hypothetical protein WBG30_09970 [Psychrilyobacter sp.]|uniref:hypothetical protein n=1 Tax=Psychrilyobacter sp. TaxID=2586924 RepID=UPI003C757A6D
MDSKELIGKLNLLYKDFNTNKKQYRILIDGKWGIGKSFTINELFKNKRNNQYFISLFGLKSLESLEKLIIKKVLFPTFEKLNKNNTIKTIGNLLGQITEKSPIRSPSIKNLIDVLSVEDLEFSKNSIICIDDLERVNDNIDFKELLGLFERISKKTNLIMICNLEKLKPEKEEDPSKNKYKIFQEYQEKVLDSKFKITEISEETLDGFFKNKKWDGKEIKILKELFNQYGEYNLRILEKIKTFYREIILFYKPKSFSIDHKKLILESIFYVILEDCTGNLTEEYRKNSKNFNKIMSENPQEKINRNRNAYFEVIPSNIRELVECIDGFYISKNVIKEKIEVALKHINSSEKNFKTIERCKCVFLETKDTIKNLHVEIETIINSEAKFELQDLLYLYACLLEMKEHYNFKISHEIDEKITKRMIELTANDNGKLSLRMFNHTTSFDGKISKKIDEMIEKAYANYLNNLIAEVDEVIDSLNEELLKKIIIKDIKIPITPKIIEFFKKFISEKIELKAYYLALTLYNILDDDGKKNINKILENPDRNDYFIKKRIEYFLSSK